MNLMQMSGKIFSKTRDMGNIFSVLTNINDCSRECER